MAVQIVQKNRLRRFFLFLAALLLFLLASPVTAQEHHRLTNLPHLYVNTFDGRDVTSKTTQVLARLWLVDENDERAREFHLEPSQETLSHQVSPKDTLSG